MKKSNRLNGRWAAALLLVGCLLAVLMAATAGATRVRAGNLIIDFHIGFAPTVLPKAEDVPIKLSGGARIHTSDGSYPPVARFVEAEFDKSGHVETRGLPVCPPGRLDAATPSIARTACAEAIIGTGTGKGVILFPEQGPIPASSPITFFNGPKIGGDATVIAHAYLRVPVPASILVRFRIKRIQDEYFGTRLEAHVPRIAGGAGTVTSFRVELGRKWTYMGKKMSYINAHCAHTGLHRFARGRVKFSDGTDLRGSIFTSCKVRKD